MFRTDPRYVFRRPAAELAAHSFFFASQTRAHVLSAYVIGVLVVALGDHQSARARGR